MNYKSRYTGIQIDNGIRPYMAYSAFLTQNGTNPPVPVIFENTFNFAITWVRVDVGHYTISGDFPIALMFPYSDEYDNRIMTLVGNDSYAVVGWAAVSGYNENGTTIHLYTQDMDGNLSDNVLRKFPFEIRKLLTL